MPQKIDIGKPKYWKELTQFIPSEDEAKLMGELRLRLRPFPWHKGSDSIHDHYHVEQKARRWLTKNLLRVHALIYPYTSWGTWLKYSEDMPERIQTKIFPYIQGFLRHELRGDLLAPCALPSCDSEVRVALWPYALSFNLKHVRGYKPKHDHIGGARYLDFGYGPVGASTQSWRQGHSEHMLDLLRDLAYYERHIEEVNLHSPVQDVQVFNTIIWAFPKLKILRLTDPKWYGACTEEDRKHLKMRQLDSPYLAGCNFHLDAPKLEILDVRTPKQMGIHHVHDESTLRAQLGLNPNTRVLTGLY